MFTDIMYLKTRILALFIFVIYIPSVIHAQGGSWVWIKGSNSTTIDTAVFGTQGVAAAANTPEGFYEAVNWTDLQGNFWIFGGVDNGTVSFLTHTHHQGSDLWKYNPITNQWTWVKGSGMLDQSGAYGTIGVPAPANRPGARAWGCMSWTDNAGNLWLMGGLGFDGGGQFGLLNDLWKYNITSNEWTWVSGSSAVNSTGNYGTIRVPSATNQPPARQECNSAWVGDNNDLWFFGGIGAEATACFGDVWRFDMTTNQWTWMKGPSDTINAPSYGTMGVELSSNNPSSRASYTRWKDAAGNFYVWGGLSRDGVCSDVWRFSPVTNNWTWIAGDSTPNAQGNYQTYCAAWPEEEPMARFENRTVQGVGCTDAFLAFGGSAGGNNAWLYNLNDLWLYNIQTNKWKWISGSNTINSYGSYGVQGVASATNMPRALTGSCMWMDHNGVLWLFGGADAGGMYNDIWKFTPDPSCAGITLTGGIGAHLASNPICTGDTSLLMLSNVSNVHISPSSSLSWIDSLHAKLFPLVTTTYMITGNSTCRNYDTTYLTLTIEHPGILSYLISDTLICQSTSAILTLMNQANVHIVPSSSVTWLDTLHVLLHPDSTTTYLVTSSSTRCVGRDSARVTVYITQPLPYSMVLADSITCYGHTAIASLTGLHNVTIFAWDYLGSSYMPDSTHIVFNHYQANDTFAITAHTSCEAIYHATLNLHSVNPGVLYYQLSKSEICSGDSALLTLTGANIRIVPSLGVRWLDSAHAMLHPDTNTLYNIYGSGCSGFDSAAFAIRVIQPGVPNYSLYPVICPGTGTEISIYGLKNVIISPGAYLDYTDSVNSKYWLSPTTTTTYTISGNSVCGGYETAQVKVYVSAGSYCQLSKPFICRGDTASIKAPGIINLHITPNVNLTWIDSADAVIHPDSTTTYIITGLACTGPVNDTVTLQVGLPGVGNFTLSHSSGICPPYWNTEFLNIFGIINPSLSPFANLFMVDTTHYYCNLNPTSTTTYLLTGRSVCGGYDTTHFTVHVFYQPNHFLQKKNICRGDSSLLSLYGFSNIQITPVSNITWVDSSTDSAQVFLHPDTTTTYIVSGINCSGYYSTYLFTLRVIIPGVLNYTLGPGIVCVGDSSYLNLYGVTDAHISPASNLHWPDSTDAYTYLPPNVTTTYLIAGHSICGELDTAYATLTVVPQASATVNKTILCNGDSALLTFTGLSNIQIVPATGITWRDSAHVSLTPQSTTSYHITADSVCGGHFFQVINMMVATTGHFNYTLSDSVACFGSGNTMLLKVDGVINPQTTPYSNFSSGGGYGVTFLNPAGIGTTNYVLTGQSVCGGYDTVIIHTFVTSGPGSFVLSSPSVCSRDSIKLTLSGFSAINISPSSSVTWQGGMIAWLHPDTTTTYDITGTAACTGPYSEPVTVSVSSPVVVVSNNTNVICPGDSTLFCATAGYASYLWNTGQVTTCIEAKQAGNYYVTISDTNGCTAKSNHLALVVYSEPPVSISINGDTLAVYNTQGQQWYLNGNLIPGATGSTYIATSAGDYTVTTIDTNGCTTTSNQVAVGLNNITADKIQIYPNPLSTGNWTLIVTNDLIGATTEIFDAEGRIVFKSEIRNLKSEIGMDVARGVYLLRISAANGSVVKKLVKL